MSSAEQALAEREVGQFPLSIATSLALEGALGIHPDHEAPNGPPPIRSYNRLWVNVATLVRNIYSSLPAETQAGVTDDELRLALYSDMQAISGVLQDQVGDSIRPVFYRNTLTSLEKHFPKAHRRQPTTDKQKTFVALREGTLATLDQLLTVEDYRVFDVQIQGEGKALMITHFPVDLLSFYEFDDLALLESHTGLVKKKSDWGSKLYPRDPKLPFNKFMLQLFGDDGLFSPHPIKYRKAVLEIAKKERWSPATTYRKIGVSLGTIKDYEIRTYLQDILSNS
jgi:hypothetical protein